MRLPRPPAKSWHIIYNTSVKKWLQLLFWWKCYICAWYDSDVTLLTQEDHSRVLRVSNDRLPVDWRRPRGRARQSWLRTIQSNLKPLKLGLHSALWRATDRPSWRRIVETAMLFERATRWWWCYIWHKVHYSGCYKGGRPRQSSTSGRGGSYSKWSHCHQDCQRLRHVPTSRCIFVAFSISMDFLVKDSQVKEWYFVTLQQTICKIAARNILAFGSTWKCTTSSFFVFYAYDA